MKKDKFVVKVKEKTPGMNRHLEEWIPNGKEKKKTEES